LVFVIACAVGRWYDSAFAHGYVIERVGAIDKVAAVVYGLFEHTVAGIAVKLRDYLP